MIVSPDGDIVNDLLKVRAIFRWIVSYDIMNIDTDVLPPDGSPLEHFLKIQCEIGDHAHLFYTMCSLADIPCVIINGMTKSAIYELGGEVNRENMASQWNAVYVDGEWRIVDCFWASVCVDDRNSIDRIEVTKKRNLKRVSENGEGPVPFNEFYFLVDPNQLLWTHLADDRDWQLVETPITEEKFQERVYIREQFHLLEMEISNGCTNCILHTDGDPIEIVFKLPKTKGRFYKFAYSLTQSRTQVDTDGTEKPVDLLLERFVFFEHTDGQVKFTIRLPLTGMFQLDIFAVDVKKSKAYKLLCTYLIQCDEKKDNILPFPDCPDLGWGVSPHAQDAGIRLRNREDYGGRILTKTGEIELVFEVQDIPFLSNSLKNVLINEALLSKYILAQRDKEKYIVKIRLPREGEYGLKIFADDGGNKIENYIPKDIIHLLICFEGGGKKINEPFPNIAGGNLGTKPYAEKFGIDVLSYQNGMIKAWGGRARVEFETHTDRILLMCDLSCSDRDAQARSKIETTHVDNHWVFDLTLPVPGDYSMNVLATMEEDSSNVYEVQSYMITSIVTDVKRVKFAEDAEDVDDIITATIRTSEETITIPIPNADAAEKVFTRISRRDGRDGENGTRPSVVVNKESFDITLREDGEYVMDVWAQDKSNVLDTVARFTICRRPSIDSYTDDIEALIESLKPQEEMEEEVEEEIEENSEEESEEVNEETDDNTTFYTETEGDENYEDDNNDNQSECEENEDQDAESIKDEEDQKIKTDAPEQHDNDEAMKSESTPREINNVVVVGVVADSNKKESKDVKKDAKQKDNCENNDADETPIDESPADDSPADEKQETKPANESSSNDNHGEVVVAGAVSGVIITQKENQSEDCPIKTHDSQDKLSDDVISYSDGKSIVDTDTESILTLQDNNNQRTTTRMDSVSVSAFGMVAAHVISEDKVEDDDEDDYDDDERLTNDSQGLFDIEENNMNEDQDKYRAARRRTIVRKLHRAIRDRKLKELTQIFQEYKATKPPKDDELRREARRIINQLKAKDNLITATLSKDPDTLREAITRAHRHNYNMALTVQILLAGRLLERYVRMKKIESTVIEMNQNAVTEMKKYAKPPNGVHQTLGATFLLLGEDATVVKNWKKCHALLFKTGKNGILRRVGAFDPKDTNPTIVAAAKKILSRFEYLQIRDVSKGAAAFFTWANNMVQQAESYRNSLRKSGKTSARNIGPRSASMAPYSGRRQGTTVLKM
ncbi:uncharacterized protein LOC133174911 [Saccostrea echinata]|uniref:uncharacterized protein LOC133174911 n=1 Tax=Saccostrea echinata TaxID=191078 RepID=UPI002A820EEB|nr:uncharacterized protein LOC133174911 [Saccostrea echinata]